MRVYWWQGGLHIESENDEESECLKAVMALLESGTVKVGHPPRKPTGPDGPYGE